jgi:tetratricopeptide (TPR) repeat protein
MVQENLRLFFKIFTNPQAAMGDLIDRGDWLFSAVAATVVAFLLTLTVSNRLHYNYEAAPVNRSQPVSSVRTPAATTDEEEAAELQAHLARRTQRLPLPWLGQFGWWVLSFNPYSLYAIALSLAALYVPAVILLLVLIERSSSFSVEFRRDYGSLLICALMAWAAAHLPGALLGVAVPAGDDVKTFALYLLGNLYFAALMTIAVRTVCGANLPTALLVACVAGLALRFDSWLFSIVTFSPFLTIIWLLPLVLGAAYGVRAAHIQRQSFRRYLESCTINERDAEAHYQLGLIHQQRRQFKEAAARFKRAVEIDPREPDANFQLGRLAREEKRLQDALDHFSVVLAHDDKFRQSEVWREIGATYLAAGMYQEAYEALEKYHARRPYDPEGLYHFGETLLHLGKTERAAEMFQQCIESVNTMPYYRRNEVSKWRRMAQAKRHVP